MNLENKICKPCERGEEPFSFEQAQMYLKEVEGWSVENDNKKIYIEKETKHFSHAVDLIVSIRDLAEENDHHPDIHLTGYKKLKIELSTHSIGGLSENDFILASKINTLF